MARKLVNFLDFMKSSNNFIRSQIIRIDSEHSYPWAIIRAANKDEVHACE